VDVDEEEIPEDSRIKYVLGGAVQAA